MATPRLDLPGPAGRPQEERIQAYRGRVTKALEQCLASATASNQQFGEAMRYAVLNGGKRIRPLLVYAVGELLEASPEQLDAPACAVELIHCYSLVHDDLPAMDDDDLRRGQPTCHRKYGEGTAILVGDALQALAFQVLCTGGTERALDMVLDLAHACGSAGMVGGQQLDLAAAGKPSALAELEQMHRMKTGALICAAIRLGVHAAGGNDGDLARLDAFGDSLGLAFQVHDDILDVAGSTATLGKPQGSDKQQAKPTFPGLLGLDEARRTADAYQQRALDALKPYGDKAGLLNYLADYSTSRDY